ncbi:cell growth-regulating nucleolar protein [Anoplophora glabripennis]|uniref:cell growth-regulating nucleolar protein n=1 Tax=Anoplophora glabripennis TaxID=217634 RepID=UPI0008753DAD|nr:cell growth-regulating nucleolar protein [Anoplophora glabripennis]
MVVFTCNHCGDSLQKPKVEKHYSFACRADKSLTCVDCFKDFRGEEYVTHTKCLTEDERYAAKGTYVNGIVKKGEVKQESWVEMIKSILDKENNLKPSCRNLLNTISHYDNIPRKKPKFINFIKSSSGGRVNMKDVEDVWNIIEKYKNENAGKAQTINGHNEKVKKESQNGDDSISEEKNSKNKENETKKRKTAAETEDSPKKKKYKKVQQIDETIVENENVSFQNDDGEKKKKHKKVKEMLDINGETSENVKFNFKEKILEVVTAKQSISLKKLQKKILKAYLKETGESEITPTLIKKFNKKLKKIPNLEINDDKVTVSERNN